MKHVKKFCGFVVDNFRPIWQLVLLVLCLIIPIRFNFAETIRMLFRNQSPDFATVKFYYLMEAGNFVMGCILLLFVLIKYVRKSNKEILFLNANLYHDYIYLWFYFCSKILGYKKCNLIRVPIYTGFKLVMRGTFEDYPFPENSFPNADLESEVIESNKDKKSFCEYNLILEDTYPIRLDQIPEDKRDLYTIKIKHKNKADGIRVYSKNFVSEVCATVTRFPEQTSVNIFATTNPKHTKEIAQQVFAKGNRGNISKVYVFQQESTGNRNFIKKHYIN